MAVATEYNFLISRADTAKKQLYVKGRGCLTARDVVGTLMSNRLTPEQTADVYSLPVEAVLEACLYYEENKSLVDAEVSEERRLAGLD
ncbi:MAG TPA: hypothetical protein VN687_09120 [Blastocatellia bacterium]|nr:hypothetical protein [Blastocatellia bacterium]